MPFNSSDTSLKIASVAIANVYAVIGPACVGTAFPCLAIAIPASILQALWSSKANQFTQVATKILRDFEADVINQIESGHVRVHWSI